MFTCSTIIVSGNSGIRILLWPLVTKLFLTVSIDGGSIVIQRATIGCTPPSFTIFLSCDCSAVCPVQTGMGLHNSRTWYL
jgi:hypothetical protein